MNMEKSNQLPRIISSITTDVNCPATRETIQENITESNDSASPMPKKSSNTNENNEIHQPKPRLILHFDINETILIGDDAGGDTVDDCLNKIIAKSAFVKIPPPPSDLEYYESTRDIMPVQWWDGTLISSSSFAGTTAEERIAIDEQKSSVQNPVPLYTGWHWPKDSCPYYRTALKKKAKQFTMPNEDGEIYRPLYEHLKHQLPRYQTASETSLDQMNKSSNYDKNNHDYLPDSHPFFRMLPSFFHTLVKLQEEQREYTLVLRTFGTDLEDIALALSDFANGKHPLYPNFYEPSLVLDKNNLFKGRWRRSNIDNNQCLDDCEIDKDTPDSSVFDLLPWENNDMDGKNCNDTSSKNVIAIASGDDQVLSILEQSSVIGINDDYHHWDKNNNAPWAAKPVWIHGDNKKYHHIFFDDNIHNDANDSIVAVRTKIDNNWISLTGSETINQHGKYIFRVPTVEVLLNNEWFYERILSAEASVK